MNINFDWTRRMEYLVVDSDGVLVGESDYITDALHLASQRHDATVVTYVEPHNGGGDCYPVAITPLKESDR